MRTILPALVLAIGLALTFGRMYAAGEPGAVPLLLVVVGAVWLSLARLGSRSRRTEPPQAGA